MEDIHLKYSNRLIKLYPTINKEQVGLTLEKEGSYIGKIRKIYATHSYYGVAISLYDNIDDIGSKTNKSYGIATVYLDRAKNKRKLLDSFIAAVGNPESIYEARWKVISVDVEFVKDISVNAYARIANFKKFE